MKNTKKGFTLVELLVVIAILAILASVAVVGYTAFVDRAHESKVTAEKHQITSLIEAELMVSNVVKVAENNVTSIYVYKTDAGMHISTTAPAATVKVEDLSDELKEFKLALDGIKLVYGDDKVEVYAGIACADVTTDEDEVCDTCGGAITTT